MIEGAVSIYKREF